MKNIPVYTFGELSGKAQERAISSFADINVDYGWWEFILDDAKNVNIDIEDFDIDRGAIKAQFTDSACHVACRILKDHGPVCDTYKTAKAFTADRDALVERHSDGINTNVVAEGNEQAFDEECDDLEEDFLKDLGKCYLSLLRKENEYLTSDESIIDTIESNNYHFTEDGTFVRS